MTNERREVVWYRRVCRMVAVFPLVIGGTVVFTGNPGFQVLFGVEVGDVNNTLESAVRIFFATMIFGALARLIGIGAHGTWNLMSVVLIGIELTGAPKWLWHRRILWQP